VGHIPFDVKKRTWADARSLTRPIFDVPAEKLPPLTESLEVMGRVTAECAEATGLAEGLPVYAIGADKAAETIGLGCVEKNMAAMSRGTMASVTFNSPDYLEPDQFIPPYPSIIPGWYCPEYQIYRGYWLVSWFKKYFCEMEAIEAAKQHVSVEEYLNRSLKSIPAGCEGLFLSPFFTPDVAQPYARGAFVGLSDYHTKRHMYRAVIEGINFALLEGLRKMESRGKFKFTEIRAGGGGSQSPEFCQIIADMFGIPVVRTENHEVSALGAAVTAFVALGEYGSFAEACEKMVRIRDRFEPDPERHKTYTRLFGVYKKIYPALKPLYAELAAISRK
jgi:sugar (pentulose or hexulose) kinase